MDEKDRRPGSQVVEGRKGAWAWSLAGALLVERWMAWLAFPLERPYHVTSPWEGPFLWAWGLGLGGLAVVLVLFRHRAGGWLAFLSGLALVARACIPLVEPEPLGQAAEALALASAWLVMAFFAAGTSMTLAFLYEQGFWEGLEQDPKDR